VSVKGRVTFPVPPERYDVRYQSELVRVLEQLDAITLKRGADVELYPGRLILRSPNGTRWQIKVSDTGQISAEVV
jgi:hypothetical protein